MSKEPGAIQRTFLTNHADCLASIDFFVVPTATFHLLFGFIVLHHERRQIVHFGVTANPTMAWVAQQIREAFPWGTAPRYLIREPSRRWEARWNKWKGQPLCARLSIAQKDSIPLVCAMPLTYSETGCLTVWCGFGMPSVSIVDDKTLNRRSVCYSARRFDADRRANPLRSLDSEGSNFRAE